MSPCCVAHCSPLLAFGAAFIRLKDHLPLTRCKICRMYRLNLLHVGGIAFCTVDSIFSFTGGKRPDAGFVDKGVPVSFEGIILDSGLIVASNSAARFFRRGLILQAEALRRFFLIFR